MKKVLFGLCLVVSGFAVAMVREEACLAVVEAPVTQVVADPVASNQEAVAPAQEQAVVVEAVPATTEAAVQQ